MRSTVATVAGRPAASPLVAVDVVIFTIAHGALQALLVEVKNGPFAGRWAFPGGLVSVGESPETTATRELFTQTGIHDLYLEQLRTFGEPARDPHAHVVSVAYFALVPSKDAVTAGSPKYTRLEWFPVRALPSLAYDHTAVAHYALTRLQAKLETQHPHHRGGGAVQRQVLHHADHPHHWLRRLHHRLHRASGG